MAKLSQTIRFLNETARVDTTSASVPRLLCRYSPVKIPLTYRQVSEIIKADELTHNYFLDTNFLTSHEVDECVWDALDQKRVTLTKGVWEELGPWRSNPHCNGHLVAKFNEAKWSDSKTVLFDQDFHNGTFGNPRAWYVNVLAERKRRAKALVDDFIEAHQRQPSPEELNRLFQRRGGERDFPIYRKGYAAIESGRGIFTDEELVATAAMASVLGSGFTILTRDHDVLEQFYVLVGLMNWHCQATLFAERYANIEGSFVRSLMPSTPELNLFFNVGESFLVKKPVEPDSFVEWLLPQQVDPFYLRCALFGGPPDAMTVTFITYIGETSMFKLVEAKAHSYGLHTNLLNGRNCHVTGFPIGVDDPRSYVIIAEDKLCVALDSPLKFPKLDLEHATRHSEVLRRLETPNPASGQSEEQ